MTYIKNFINEFNFPSPNWNNLPIGFPNLDKTVLSKEEKHLLGAIILAWQATHSQGRRCLSRKITKVSAFMIICLISLIGLIRLINLSQGDLAKPVLAATETVNQVIQSSMSAILKK